MILQAEVLEPQGKAKTQFSQNFFTIFLPIEYFGVPGNACVNPLRHQMYQVDGESLIQFLNGPEGPELQNALNCPVLSSIQQIPLMAPREQFFNLSPDGRRVKAIFKTSKVKNTFCCHAVNILWAGS